MRKFTKDQIEAVMDMLNQAFDASIQSAQVNAPNEISTLRLDLSDGLDRGQARKISFPFTSVFVEDASDLNTFVRIIPNSSDTIQEDVLLKKRDSYIFDRGVRESYLYWPAQPGKSIILKFFVSSKFNNGSLIIDQTATPARVEIGHASGDLDGFTRQVFFSWNITEGMTEMRDIGGNKNNVGTFTNNTTTFSNFFKVPLGYTAESIGCELEVIEPIDSINTFRVYAVNDGKTVTDDDFLNIERIGYLTNTGAGSDPAVGRYNVRVVNFDTDEGIFIEENQIIAVGSPAAYPAGTTGEYEGFFLVRLRQKVGG